MTSRSLTSSTTMSEASLSDAASAAATASETARSDAVTSSSLVIVAPEHDDDVGDGLADRTEFHVRAGKSERAGNRRTLGPCLRRVGEDEHSRRPVAERIALDVAAVDVGVARVEQL